MINLTSLFINELAVKFIYSSPVLATESAFDTSPLILAGVLLSLVFITSPCRQQLLSW